MKQVLLLVFCCIFFSPKGVSKETNSLKSKIKGFLDSTNTPSNITSAQAINDDVIGMNYLGGAGYIRTEVSDVNPVHITLPTISAGCGGIDYNLGGINIASKSEMKNALKSIAKNGATHAFLLALETVSPLTGDVMSKIQTWANQINAININSCEIGSSLVEGIWPKSANVSEYICSQSGSKHGLFRDRIESRHGCKNPGGENAKKSLKQAQKQGLLVGDYNLAWEVIKKMGLGNDQIKDLYLNISGTIIQSDGRANYYPSQIEKAIEVLVFGGEITNAYRFNSKDPLQLRIGETIVIPKQRSEKEKIQTLLLSIQDKILNEGLSGEQKLSSEEKELIYQTQFPIASLMILMGQWGGENVSSHVSQSQCAEIIAFERVSKYVEEIIRSVQAQAIALQTKQFDEGVFQQLTDQLKEGLVRIERLKLENYRKMSEKQKLIQFLIDIERSLRDNPGGNL